MFQRLSLVGIAEDAQEGADAVQDPADGVLEGLGAVGEPVADICEPVLGDEAPEIDVI